MRIVTTSEMRDIERASDQSFGLSESLIIENVGLRGADFLIANYLKDKLLDIIFVIGKGNNGADGLAIARNLYRYGYKVTIFMLEADSACSIESQKQIKMIRAYGISLSKLTESRELDHFLLQHPNSLLIDAIFGTGIRLPLNAEILEVIASINEHASLVGSIDIPSGIEGDSGKMVGQAVQADFTMAVGLPKIGLYVSAGIGHCGEISILDGGFPHLLLTGGDKYLLEDSDVKYLSVKRDKFAHKGDYGKVAIVGGSKGLTGALVLASEAAIRVGTGLVTAITWEEDYLEFTAQVAAEVMKDFIPCCKDRSCSLIKQVAKYDAIVVGPGLGRGDDSRQLVLQLIENYQGPLVLDADAINELNLGEDTKRLKARVGQGIITPHFGEFARLIAVDIEILKSDPISYIRKFVEETQTSVVLKGATTYIASTSGSMYILHRPNDGMATAGSGDVLSGIIGGLLAQGFVKSVGNDNQILLDKFVSLGVLLHSLAGKYAVNNLGERFVSARDFINHLSIVFSEIEK